MRRPSVTFSDVEPPHRFLLEPVTSVVHHGDYLGGSSDHALCGQVVGPGAVPSVSHVPSQVCPDCAARLAEYHAQWWREQALALAAELAELRTKYRELAGEPPQSLPTPLPHPVDATVPASPLERARRELVALCGSCGDTVPFFRLKKSMQTFSDTLASEDRVLLAQEIGVHGSLIRWSVTEVEALGRQVANNPVTGDAEDMAQHWQQDADQTPRKSKWLGRSRTHRDSQ